MNIQNSFFYPNFFGFFQFDHILFYQHIDFFQDLFDFLIMQKNYFFYYPSQVISAIIKKFYEYIINNMHGSKLKPYFLSVLTYLQKNNHHVDQVYSYLISFCSLIFFYSFYQMAIIECSQLFPKGARLEEKITLLCQKYNIKAKRIVILKNKNLGKGIRIFFKNMYQDLSLKKILDMLAAENI